MKKEKIFGELVPGVSIRVLNEREIRAAAGILFVLVFMSIQRVVFLNDFMMLKFVTTFFFFDFCVRVFLSPRFSPSLLLGRWFVRNQTPEYVGAAQKLFAWKIGVVLSALMVGIMNIANYHTPISGMICIICLVFLFAESAFGICLGCKFYPLIYGKAPELCPGEVCEPKARQPIQMIDKNQIIALVAFALAVAVSIPALKGYYSIMPTMSMGMELPNPNIPHPREASLDPSTHDE